MKISVQCLQQSVVDLIHRYIEQVQNHCLQRGELHENESKYHSIK